MKIKLTKIKEEESVYGVVKDKRKKMFTKWHLEYDDAEKEAIRLCELEGQKSILEGHNPQPFVVVKSIAKAPGVIVVKTVASVTGKK